jgi:hypothetical protein
MTLILPIPDTSIIPTGPTGWTDHKGGSGFPTFTDNPSDTNSGGPKIGFYTDSANGDETVAIRGDNLANASYYQWSEGMIAELSPLRAENANAQVVLNASGRQSVTFLWAFDDTGVSDPARINAPKINFVSPGRKLVSTDRTIRIFGKHLGVSLQAGQVVIQIGSATPVKIETTSVTENVITALLPSSYTAGSYKVWVHNGTGGKYGWSDYAEFTVIADTYTAEYTG